MEPNRTTVELLWEIGSERQRQISVEGWTPEHDDRHDCDELSKAAACYCIDNTHVSRGWDDPGIDAGGASCRIKLWPWDREFWKPKHKRRNLIKAAALIVAEIERIDRASAALEADIASGRTPF